MSSPEPLLRRLSKNASLQPQKPLFSFLLPGPMGGKLQKQLTYDDVQQESSKVAQRLLEEGLSKGDRAVLVYPPSLDFMIAFLACLKVGIIAVPVFPPNPSRRDTLHMFSKITESCNAKYALTSVEYDHLKKIAGIRDVVMKLKRPIASWPEQLKWITTNDKTTPKGKFQDPNIDSHSSSDIAFLQYTSGSTSEPKGVMITHGNLAHNLSIITNELNAIYDTIVVSWLPQYHDMGLIGSYLGVIYCGGSGYYISPLSFLQRPMLWMEAVSKYKATHLQAPNFAFKLTARKFLSSNYSASNSTTSTNNKNNQQQSLQLSSVRHIINAAEPVDEDALLLFQKTFGPYGLQNVIYPTYGLAEHTVFVCSGGTQKLTVLKQDLEVEGKVVIVKNNDTVKEQDVQISRLVGCGYPSRQNVDVRIVNRESCQELMEDQVGEIWVRSPSKAMGYYEKPVETKEDFHAKLLQDTENGDGFLRTGDLGFLHKKELFICGRLKDLIIVAGRNYYPQDLEATAESVSTYLRPGCSAAFTIDPTNKGGEQVALVMELRELPPPNEMERFCSPLAEQVRSAINQEHSLGIAQIQFLKTRTVPKTSSGKIARAWCRKGFLAGTLQVVYRKSFKDGMTSYEIDASDSNNNNDSQRQGPISEAKLKELRAMNKNDILKKLTKDLSRVGGLPDDAIAVDAALVTILDSLNLSQFKGLLESHYGVTLSDEYLFRETTTLEKLVEVVKLGSAPDDDGENNNNGNGENGNIPSNAMVGSSQGTADGIAGALGCPPGVVCCVIQ